MKRDASCSTTSASHSSSTQSGTWPPSFAFLETRRKKKQEQFQEQSEHILNIQHVISFVPLAFLNIHRDQEKKKKKGREQTCNESFLCTHVVGRVLADGCKYCPPALTVIHSLLSLSLGVGGSKRKSTFLYSSNFRMNVFHISRCLKVRLVSLQPSCTPFFFDFRTGRADRPLLLHYPTSALFAVESLCMHVCIGKYMASIDCGIRTTCLRLVEEFCPTY